MGYLQVLARIKVLVPNQSHYDIIADRCGESEVTYKLLGCVGFKIMVLVNGEPIVIFLTSYGSKPKHAYIANLWIDGSPFSKRILAKGIKMFNIVHKGWNVYFHSNVASKFKNHCIRHNDRLFKYTGNL